MPNPRRFDALLRRRYELQQTVYRNSQIIQNGDWRNSSNELQALHQQLEFAQAELNEIGDLVDDNGHAAHERAPISWHQYISLLIVVLASSLVLVMAILLLGGH